MLGNIAKFFIGLIAGCLGGAIVASLLTPKSGAEFRGEIRTGFDEIKLDYESGKQKKREELEADLKRRWGEE